VAPGPVGSVAAAPHRDRPRASGIVDDLLRRPEHDDGPTIGILLAATRNDVVVEYALRGLGTPLAVSTYTTTAALLEDVRRALPSVEDLTNVVRRARVEPG
jgi:hypothetical protein